MSMQAWVHHGNFLTSSNPPFSVELNRLYMSVKTYTATEALKVSSLSLIVDWSNSSASSGSCFTCTGFSRYMHYIYGSQLHLQHLQWLLDLHSHQPMHTMSTHKTIKQEQNYCEAKFRGQLDQCASSLPGITQHLYQCIRESARTPYVGMTRIPPSRNTLHSQPYLAPEQTFSPQIQHR